MPLKDLFKKSTWRTQSPSRRYMPASTKKLIDGIPKEKKNGYKKLFDQFDKNRDGRLEAAELQAGLKELGQKVSLDDAKQIIKKTDINGDNVLDFCEFLLVVLTLGQAPAQNYVRKIFDQLDKNKDNKLDKKEVADGMKAVELSVTEVDIDHMMAVADLDKDGMITFEEFCNLLDVLYSNGGLTTKDLN